MSKYLELFKESFDGSIIEKTKLENKPYIGYSLTEGKMVYTVVPKPVTGPADNEIWYTSNDGSIVTPADSGVFGANIVSNTYENGKGVITFNEPVTSIGGDAFSWCESLTSVTIPNTITSIGSSAFEGCSSLTSITIPNTITSIESSAFDDTGIYNDESNWENNVLYMDNCLIEAKESISGSYTIKENTRLIANYAFAYCSSLTSITIPNSVTSIGDYAFWACSSLISIEFQGTMDQWNAINKGSDWNGEVPATEVICTDGTVTIA